MIHAANADLGHHVLDAFDPASAHDHQGVLIGVMGKTLLAHFDDFAVVGRHSPAGPNRLAWRVRRSRISAVSSA